MKILFAAFALSLMSPLAGMAQDASKVRPSMNTRFEHVDMSLETLLRAGFDIKQMDAGLLILSKQVPEQKSVAWVACRLQITNGALQDSSIKEVPSACYLLN